MNTHKYDFLKVLGVLIALFFIGFFVYKHNEDRKLGQSGRGINFSRTKTPTNSTGSSKQLEGTINKYLLGTGLGQSINGFEVSSEREFKKAMLDSGIHMFGIFQGTDMNWWHWQGNGMGILANELSASGSIGNKENEADLTTKLNYRFYDKYVDLIKSNGVDTKAFIELNIVTQSSNGKLLPIQNDQASINLSINENLSLLKDLASKGVNVAGVQLGTEIYLSAYRGVFKNVDAYIARAKPVAKAIHNLYPNIAIVVPVANPNKQNSNTVDFANAWNDELAKNNKIDPWFDGILYYMSVDNYENIEGECNSSQTNSQFDCFKKIVHKFTNEFSSIVDGYSATFPNEKTWIGQWNLDNNGANPNIFTGMSVANTIAHALYISDYITETIKYNDSHSNIIQNIGYMTFGGQLKNMISKYDPNSDDKGNVIVSNSQFVTRTPLLAHKILAPIFDGSHKFVDIKTKKIPSGISSDDLKILKTYNVSTKEDDYIITNWSGNTVSLDEILINDSPILAKDDSIKIASLSGSNLWSTYGAKAHNGNFSPVSITDFNEARSTGTKTIPAYSLNRITILSKQ